MRLAIGSGKCADLLHHRNHRVRELCSRITSRIQQLRGLSPDVLFALPSVSTDLERIDSQHVALTTFRDTTVTGSCLVVVQGFLPSWSFPRYFGPAGIGFMVAEGILQTEAGAFDTAPDDLLWDFR